MELLDGVGNLSGVGSKREAALERLGIVTLFDLLTYYPRSYIDQSTVTPFSALTAGMEATVSGVVMNVREHKAIRGMHVLTAYLSDGTGYLSMVWFNQPFLAKFIVSGRRVFATGKVDYARGGKGALSMAQIMAFSLLEDASDSSPKGLLPIYAATASLSQKFFRSLIAQAFRKKPVLPEVIPESVRERYGLLGRDEAFLSIHFPKTKDTLSAARMRLAFEELYLIQCGLFLVRKQAREKEQGIRHLMNGRIVKKIFETLPFSLTKGQEQAWKEISADMEKSTPMRRLVQGDVGSGKTVLALLALAKTVENGYQGALLAPTEILARQHYETFSRLLADTGIKVGLLSGKLSAKQHEEILSAIAANELDIVIGTHALIQDKVHYHELGLVVTDEQHRFGIAQRAELKKRSAKTPDVLVMTATPIPRTMTLTVYGDLDVSRIEELPPGRRPVRTFVRTNERRGLIYDFVKKEIANGRQAYVVCPLIEESEDSDLPSAETVYKELSNGIFRGISCGLVHGKLKAKEKEAAMRSFYEGKTKLLIATTVIEVGVDVPNASVIVVENAERFGLAQLHQLRGRIGRGQFQSYCILLAGGEAGAASERLRAMEKTTNGFVLAEEDLRLRGPGQFFGSMQHGLGDLKIANVLRDTEILLRARRAAMETMEEAQDMRYVLEILRLNYSNRFGKILDA
ncbi:MAG: ATP-dependent DNA helicase RecG [Selenomonadaceae bacterium]|nr:ATP-dependent DNA helicase RecG [Selenomonadaceae bacterium]